MAEAGSGVARVDAATVRGYLKDGRELALLDVREEGAYGDGHLLFAVSLPLSRLELDLDRLVPRRSARVVLCDGGEGLAERAADKMRRFGYTDLAILDGGIEAWRAAGYVLFTGVHVPSKAFGEFVEHKAGTPSISAEELKKKLDAKEDVVVLDSRPWDEYVRMNIPTGIDTPGAELVYRIFDIAPNPDTQIVVNCAGRTRSIIGAQSLINAGVPNKVVALRNGTMGWELAGFEVERGQTRRAGDVSPAGLAKARGAAEAVALRFGVPRIDLATLENWRVHTYRRSLYVLDVRSPEEYMAGHLEDAVSAPGGQLVQATGSYVGTLGARLVLVDDTEVRAIMTASWLIQMGWREVAVLAGGIGGLPLVEGPERRNVLGLDAVRAEEIAPLELDDAMRRGKAVVVDLAPSPAYRAAHVKGAWYAQRASLAQALPALPECEMLVLTSEDGVLAKLAAEEAARLTRKPVRVLAGGTAAWRVAGLPLGHGEEHLALPADDVVLKAYDRQSGIQEAMKEYLDWEVALVHQIEEDGTTEFRHFPG